MTQITDLILVGEIKRLQGVLIESQKMADHAAGAIQECMNLQEILKTVSLDEVLKTDIENKQIKTEVI